MPRGLAAIVVRRDLQRARKATQSAYHMCSARKGNLSIVESEGLRQLRGGSLRCLCLWRGGRKSAPEQADCPWRSGIQMTWSLVLNLRRLDHIHQGSQVSTTSAFYFDSCPADHTVAKTHGNRLLFGQSKLLRLVMITSLVWTHLALCYRSEKDRAPQTWIHSWQIVSHQVVFLPMTILVFQPCSFQILTSTNSQELSLQLRPSLIRALGSIPILVGRVLSVWRWCMWLVMMPF